MENEDILQQLLEQDFITKISEEEVRDNYIEIIKGIEFQWEIAYEKFNDAFCEGILSWEEIVALSNKCENLDILKTSLSQFKF